MTALSAVGITATRNGLGDAQADALRAWLLVFRQLGARDFHHGDCVGGDVQGAALARELGYRIVAHPPLNPRLRADFPSDEVRPELDYHDRNRNIVQESGVLFACPADMQRQTGGTWWTIRHARAVGAMYAVEIQRPLIVVGPDGRVEPT